MILLIKQTEKVIINRKKEEEERKKSIKIRIIFNFFVFVFVYKILTRLLNNIFLALNKEWHTRIFFHLSAFG